MWLWYDWQAAAVADEHGHLVDVMQWDGHMTEHAVVERLRLIASGQPIREAVTLHERFPEAVLCVHGDPQLPDAQWPVPSAEQQALADSAALRWRWKASKRRPATPTAVSNTSSEAAMNCGPAT